MDKLMTSTILVWDRIRTPFISTLNALKKGVFYMRHGFGTGQKYNNKQVTYQGSVYDSKKELARWQELQLLEKAGKISDLRRQVRFELIPAQTGKYRHERPCVYNADFVYVKNGETVVEDTKGVRDAKYVIKRKLMLQLYGYSILET